MKIILILLFLFFSVSLSYSQKKATAYKKNKTELKVLKVITIGNEDNYYTGKLMLTNDFSNDSIALINNDTLTILLDERSLDKYELRKIIINIRTKYKLYEYGYGEIKDFSKLDTINIVLNYDTISIKKNEEEFELEKKENEVFYKEVFTEIIKEAEENVEYYRKKIEGKSHNKIADFLYDEGFSRSFSTTGSVLKEIYSTTYIYEGISERNQSYRIKISLWNSYGYGKLIYSIDYDIYFLGKMYYWFNGEWHSI